MKLPFIKSYRTRHGTSVQYVRKRGRVVRLKLAPTDPGFAEEYEAALRKCGEEQVHNAPAGSWDALVPTFLGSRQFLKLKPSTQKELRRELERLRTRHGPKPVGRVEKRHILRWMDEAASLGRANNMLGAVKWFLTWAEERGEISSNPARGISKIKGGEWRSWTDEELADFKKVWAVGTRERLVFDLALYTGQRKGDLIRMTRSHLAGDVVKVTQAKTGARLSIPLHPELDRSIKAIPKAGLPLISAENGSPLKARYLGQLFKRAVEQAGLPDDCVLHGLRKAAARTLSEVGCSDSEIMAITGHGSAEMVRHYTRQASQEKLARSAISRLRTNELATNECLTGQSESVSPGQSGPAKRS